jgi:hypothetical protein
LRLLLSNGAEVTAAVDVRYGGAASATAADVVKALRKIARAGQADAWLVVRRDARRLGVAEREVLHLRADQIIGVVEELG